MNEGWGFLMVAVSAALLTGTITHDIVESSIQRDAIRHHVAEWKTDENMRPVFSWKEPIK